MPGSQFQVIDEHNALVVSASWQGAPLSLTAMGTPNIDALLNVTAMSGTSPTAQLVIDGSADGINWTAGGVYNGNTLAAAGQDGFFGAAGFTWIRLNVVVGGTGPSVTFTLKLLGVANG